jgi:hypothetical protein
MQLHQQRKHYNTNHPSVLAAPHAHTLVDYTDKRWCGQKHPHLGGDQPAQMTAYTAAAAHQRRRAAISDIPE